MSLLADALRAHQAAVDETKITEREANTNKSCEERIVSILLYYKT